MSALRHVMHTDTASVSHTPSASTHQEALLTRAGRPPADSLQVFLLDALCTVPYYMGALCQALRRSGADAILGSTNYYQDLAFFPSRGLRPDPGLLDVVARYGSSSAIVRRPLKLVEGVINLAALAARFAFRAPDVLHVQYLSLVPYGVPLDVWLVRWARARGSRIVYTVHDRVPHDTGTTHLERFARLYRMFDGVICHNEDTRRRLVDQFGVESARIRVIPHGPLFTDLEPMSSAAARARLALPEEGPILLWQGIVKPYKGVDFLLNAWPRIRHHRPDARLLIVGTGDSDQLDAIQHQIATLGLSASVTTDFRFVPEGDLAAYYAAADVVVLPYRDITTSGALMTALAQRKAIVATRLPAFVEVVEDGISARLVDYGDTSHLSDVVIELFERDTERDRLAAGAERAMRERFGWEAIAATTLAFYRELGANVLDAVAPPNVTVG